MATVQVRYIVHDVDAAIAFYTRHLGFQERMHPGPSFALLERGDLRLVLSRPGGQNTGGGSALPDGRVPEPGGWNRIVLAVDDLATEMVALQRAGVRFRNQIEAGPGGKQVLIEDPEGNPIELHEYPRSNR